MSNKVFSLFSDWQVFLQNRTLPFLASIVFFLLLAWQLGGLLSLVLHTPQAPIMPTLAVVTSSSPTAPIQASASLLFGEPASVQSPQKAPEAVNSAHLARTQLRLKLLGAIVTAQRAVAIIESSGKTLVVAEGQEVMSGVRLLKVYAEEVVLEHRGKREKLQMEQVGKGLIATVAQTASPQALNVEDKVLLQNLTQTLRAQPLSLSKYIRFQPVNQGGALSAVQIWPREHEAVFRALGLQAGDKLKRVNGQSMAEMAQDANGWQTFLEQSQFALQVERDGQLLDLTIDLNEWAAD